MSRSCARIYYRKKKKEETFAQEFQFQVTQETAVRQIIVEKKALVVLIEYVFRENVFTNFYNE